jgi:8-oxo-dGTP pyrophosphatase MutT (NUDIX family)
MPLLRRIGVAFSVMMIRIMHMARYYLYRLTQPTREVRGVRVILSRKGKIVLVRHWYAPGVWTLPGGGCEPYESDKEAAKREVVEETGYTVNALESEVGTYVGRFGIHDTVRVFVCSDYDGGLKLVPDFEIMQRGIFDLDKLPDTVSPANRRRIDAYLAGTRGERGRW